jgi:transcription initiation factor TFIID subunit 12
MPIPKNLPGGGVNAGRPTLGNGLGTAGGTMNQPVIQKNPTFTFEAEGEHVLNKKKLDELVRQVCGGGQPSQDGNYLTPDVEEVRVFLLRFFFRMHNCATDHRQLYSLLRFVIVISH